MNKHPTSHPLVGFYTGPQRCLEESSPSRVAVSSKPPRTHPLLALLTCASLFSILTFLLSGLVFPIPNLKALFLSDILRGKAVDYQTSQGASEFPEVREVTCPVPEVASPGSGQPGIRLTKSRFGDDTQSTCPGVRDTPF